MGSIPRGDWESLFQVFWKTTVAQVQASGSAQTEFVICDQSIDTNHGYGKTEVENSEVSKKRVALEKRLSNIQRWAVSAETRVQRASKLYNRLWQQTKQHGEQLYRALNEQVWELEAQGTMSSYQLRTESKQLQAQADAELALLWQRVYRMS